MTRQLIALTALILIAVAIAACAAPATPADFPAQEAPAELGGSATPDGQNDNQFINTKILEIGPETPLCAIFPTLDGSGQQYTSRGTEDGDTIASAFGLSHGEVVFGTITDTIYDTMGLLPETDPALITPDLYQDAVVILVVDNFQKPSVAGAPSSPSMVALYKDINILIVGVDIGSWEIDLVKQNVKNAMINLISDPEHPVVRQFVVNMSFALVPCNDAMKETLSQYQEDAMTFAEFSANLSALVAFTYGNGYTNIPSQINTGDFAGFTQCLFGGHTDNRTCGQLSLPVNANIILVGAAGNSGYDFAFAPALWDHVVSVSASDVGGGKAGYSNTGEVMMDGTTKFSHDGVDVVGTSFASPRLALEQAFYLRDITHPSEGIECDGTVGIVARPPLGYIPEAGDWDSGIPKDLPLEDARDQYCN
jgi:hypothetical protein